MSNVTLTVLLVATAVVFAILWHQGYLVRIRNYIAETQEELKKCTWPSVDELKGSTVLIMVTMALLGAFTIAVDYIMLALMKLIT